MEENNPKLFLFCIGGTGARVLKSLTFLLAAGANLKASKVIPIIIDPDSANGDVQRTIEVLKNYQAIHRRLEFQHNGFFKTDIQTLASLEAAKSEKEDEAQKSASLRISDNFRFDIDGTRDGIFGHFIGYDTMSPANRAITDALFSDKNLALELSVGFKGNPHMGSVVLNQFKDSTEFRFFASRLGQKDRIFIVSSIFGGTGAAGFPLLVKNIREASDKLSNHDRLKNAPVGAITVAPYFGVEPDDTIAIDKNTFIAKTKAALEYYSDNLSGNQSLNALYYIGDLATKDYKPAEGKAEQMNDAHTIELFSALSIFDFMNIPESELSCKDGKAETPYFKEYGIRGDDAVLTLQNLGPVSKSIAVGPLTQYALAINFWNNRLSHAIDKPENWARSKTAPIKGDFLTTDFYSQQLQRFNRRFKEWLEEMTRNIRALKAFNLDTSLLHTLANGYVPMKKGVFGGEKPAEWGYDEYNFELSAVEEKLPSLEAEKRFMALFYKATQKLFDQRFKALMG